MYTSAPAKWTWYFLIGLGVCFLVGAALIGAFAGADGAGVAYPWTGVGVILCGIGGYGIWKQKDTASLLHSGTRATATVIGVKNTGVQINNVPRFMIRLRVDRPGAPFEAQIGALTFSPAAIGSVMDVCYDPKNVKHITFVDADSGADAGAQFAAPASDSSDMGAPVADSSGTLGPNTTVQLLAQLEKMHETGALTDDEFARAKRGVLGTS